MNWETVIGLEVHAQLKTKSKIFCSCPTEFGAEPNSQVCPVCLGMPGVLPVLNEKAVEYGVKCGLALNCRIAEFSKFDRKNYFYPDLAKAYQISQYDKPLCLNGWLEIDGKRIGIIRAHLEEDAGKLVHAGAAGLHGSDYSLVDFNRSSVPLLEIVSAPDIRSPEEAERYLRELRTVLRYLEVCDGNLEEGSFRCDANVSLRPLGNSNYGTRVEIKNLNSFNAVRRAIQSEIDRQKKMLESGEQIVQETRLWNDAKQATFSMRSKEDAHDYRYFPEPDLPPLVLDSKWVEELGKTLPELPAARRARYTKSGISDEDAFILTQSRSLADFFDETVNLGVDAKEASKLLLGPCMAYLNEEKIELQETELKPQHVGEIIASMKAGILSSTTAKQVLVAALAEGGLVREIIEKKGLAQVSDQGALKEAVQAVLLANPGQLAEFRAGKTKVRQYFFGEVMKGMKGKANPQVINQILDELLSE